MKNFYIITEQNLRSIIRSILEARSSQHHTGKKLSNIHKFDLQQMSKETLENGAPKYYFSMHDYSGTPQENYGSIKINPNYKWFTPLGVYAYPLTKKFLLKMLNDTLYFLSKAKYVTILSPSDSSKMLYIKDDNDKKYFIKNLKYKLKDEAYSQIEYSKNMNKLIVDEGYNCVFDNGTSAISDMEYEICFLTPNSYKIIEQFTKKDIDDKYLSIDDKKKNKISEILNLHESWFFSKGKKGKQLNVNDNFLNFYAKDFLKEYNLKHCILIGALLNEVNLSDSNLEGIKLRNSNLRNANLKNCILYGADLQNANLEGADLSGADLRWATFYGSNLKNINLTDCKIRKESTGGISEELIKKFNMIVEE